MTWPWGLLAAVALLWPDRMVSWFDGAPLDRPAEAIAVAVVFPLLWALDPAFLKTRLARALIVTLLLWRALTSAALVQEGLCVRFQPMRPYVIQQRGAPHSWDVRADWRAPDPVCSAIMTRSYGELSEFPAWFFNLPPVGEAPLASEDRPPKAVTSMTVTGFLHATQTGLLHVEREEHAPVAIRVDGGPESDAPQIPPGTHAITMSTMLTGDRWQFVPRWDNGSPWSALLPTVRRGNAIDLFARRWMRWLPVAVVMVFLGGWIASALLSIADAPLIAWSAGASTVLVALFATDHRDAASWGIAALTLAAASSISARNRTLRGALVAVGIPWLAYVSARALPSIGRFTLYRVGRRLLDVSTLRLSHRAPGFLARGWFGDVLVSALVSMGRRRAASRLWRLKCRRSPLGRRLSARRRAVDVPGSPSACAFRLECCRRCVVAGAVHPRNAS